MKRNHKVLRPLIERACHSFSLLVVGTAGAMAASSAVYDINGDLSSDIFWRNTTTGANHYHLIADGAVAGEASFATVSTDWSAYSGNFDGDGYRDIFWRNQVTGQTWVYHLMGERIVDQGPAGMVPTEWKIAAIGDFNGDQMDDILWYHTETGTTWMNLMQGQRIVSGRKVSQISDLNWQVAASGDFNSDGRDDILWRNSATGQNWIYLMGSAGIAASYQLNVAGSEWNIVGAGDFNGDGSDDLFWRNSETGSNWIYFMQSGRIDSYKPLNTVPVEWSVVQLSDFNADGTADILWRNSQSGQNHIYLMNGLEIVKSQALNVIADQNWQPVSAAVGVDYITPKPKPKPDPKPTPDNYPPIAQAGPDVVIGPGESVVLNGQSSFDVDGSIVSYEWSTGEQSATTSITPSTEGTLLVSLKVTDDKGATGTDYVLIKSEVASASTIPVEPPVSDFSSISVPGTMNNWSFSDDMTLVADFTWQALINFSGQGDDNGPERFKIAANGSWDTNWGSDCGQDGPDIEPAGTGEYTLTFDETTGCVSQQAGNHLIKQVSNVVADAGADREIGIGCSVLLSGSHSTGATSYSWSDGQSGMKTTTPVYDSAGMYPFTLTVIGENGETDTDTVHVAVTPERPHCSGAVTEHGFPMGEDIALGNYEAQLAYPNLEDHFELITHITSDGSYIFVVERSGAVYFFPDRVDVQPSDVKLLLDIRQRVHHDHEMGMLSMALDPNYQSNGHFYVFYSLKPSLSSSGEVAGDSVVERYTVDSPANPTSASAPVIVISEGQQGWEHKGGQIQFYDGFMFVSFGDGDWARCADKDLWDWCSNERENNNGQDLTNLRGSIIRIKVNADGSYDIPDDNPFSGSNLARPEIYAYGFRNPWRFDIDPATGTIWEGDSGQQAYDTMIDGQVLTNIDSWEEVNIIERGGNYGWPVCDGPDNRGIIGGNANADCNANGFVAPEVVYAHGNKAASIIGGIFYTGSELPALRDSYFYADYDTKRLWSYQRGEQSNLIMNGNFPENPTTFGRNSRGEMLIGTFVSHDGSPDPASNIWKLVNQSAQTPVVVPQKLSESKLFTNLATQEWASGVVPVDMIADKWRDGLQASHFIALPAGRKIGYQSRDEWNFPKGTALIEHVVERSRSAAVKKRS